MLVDHCVKRIPPHVQPIPEENIQQNLLRSFNGRAWILKIHMTLIYAHHVYVAVVMIGRDAIFHASTCWQFSINFQAGTGNFYHQSTGVLLILILTWRFWTVFQDIKPSTSSKAIEHIENSKQQPHLLKFKD